jgi:hypothetical protein
MPAHSGVYRAPRALAPLRGAAAAAQCAWINIDVDAVKDKAALLKACAAALAFPATFGGNWDALADCLQDLSWRRSRGYVIYLKGAGALVRAAPTEWAIALEIFAASATYWKAHGKPFVVLVDGVKELLEFAW